MIDVFHLDIAKLEGAQANAIWDKVRTNDIAFDDFSAGRIDLFARRLSAPDTDTFINEYGLVMVEHIAPMLNGFMHCFLFGRPDREIVEEMGSTVMQRIFTAYDLHRMSAAIPASNSFAIRSASDLGMVYEGTVRETWLKGGALYDVHIYGILRSEFEERFNG